MKSASFYNRSIFTILIALILILIPLSSCKSQDDHQTIETRAYSSTSASDQTDEHSSERTNDSVDATTRSDGDGGASEESSLTETIAEPTSADESAAVSTTRSTGSTSGLTAAPTTTASRPTASTTAPATVPTTSADLQSQTVFVTIPEGFSLIQICQRLAAAGVNDFDKLFASATTDDFSAYAAIAAAGFPANRCFQLEGYLFPDTYEFYRNEDTKSVWGRFLRNFTVRTEPYRNALSQYGWTMDQAITFASLLEREAGNINEIANVSSVMHNRLNAGMRLELDASILYVEQFIKPYISGDKDRFSAHYNTYRTAALPAGPICNPGLRALNASLNPAATDFYFFANDNAAPPNYYYARTFEEHLANLEQYGIG